MNRQERIVHIGLGAFHKAHQAWYTQHANDQDWGIVAFTGRTPEAADQLNHNGCKFTLVTRFADHDEFETISSIVRAVPGTDTQELIRTLSNPDIALVTLTITEAGYQLSRGEAPETSALGRLALALDARRASHGEPIAVVSCDNMPSNGDVTKAALLSFSNLGEDFRAYLEQKVSFVTTSVDRITPKLQEEDIELSERLVGFKDSAAVVTEPFSDWVLQGEFPLGRPDWESAGAKFVPDIEMFENRKLWLLNGAHTLVSFYGQLLGYQTVDQAIADPEILSAVNQFWDEAEANLPAIELDIPEYREALLERFSNPRIGYRLEQIAKEGLTKVKVRIVPVAKLQLSKGEIAQGSIRAISSLVSFVLSGGHLSDVKAAEVKELLDQGGDFALNLLDWLSPELASNEQFVAAYKSEAIELLAATT
jgi:fructuronate reductase